MPKFVPVADPEAPRWEQDEAKLAKHRNFDSHVVARDQTKQRKLAAGRRAATNADEGRANSGFEQGAVGWGVVGTFGSEARDADAQARPAEGQFEDGAERQGPVGPRGAGGGRRGRRRESRSRSRSRSRGRRRRDRSRSRSRSRRRRRDRSRSRSPRAGGGGGRRRLVVESPRARTASAPRSTSCGASAGRAAAAPAAAASAAAASVSEKSAMPPPPPRRPPTPPPKRPPSPREHEAPPDFSFSCSQLVDRLLEVFNSDAPPQHRKAAIEQCFAEDGLSVAPLRAGKRPTAQQGMNAVASIVAASERLTEASPSIRVFMESGDEAESEPDPAHPTLVLISGNRAERAALAAVVKGTPACTSYCGAA